MTKNRTARVLTDEEVGCDFGGVQLVRAECLRLSVQSAEPGRLRRVRSSKRRPKPRAHSNGGPCISAALLIERYGCRTRSLQRDGSGARASSRRRKAGRLIRGYSFEKSEIRISGDNFDLALLFDKAA